MFKNISLLISLLFIFENVEASCKKSFVHQPESELSIQLTKLETALIEYYSLNPSRSETLRQTVVDRIRFTDYHNLESSQKTLDQLVKRLHLENSTAEFVLLHFLEAIKRDLPETKTIDLNTVAEIWFLDAKILYTAQNNPTRRFLLAALENYIAEQHVGIAFSTLTKDISESARSFSGTVGQFVLEFLRNNSPIFSISNQSELESFLTKIEKL